MAISSPTPNTTARSRPLDSVNLESEDIPEGEVHEWNGTDWGTIFERLITSATGLTRTDEWYYDAEGPEGVRFELKACRVFVGEGHAKGAFWIPENAIRELASENGYVVFGLYDQDLATRERPEQAFTNLHILPASEVIAEIDQFYELRDHRECRNAARLNWDSLFAISEVPTAAAVLDQNQAPE